MNNPASTFRWDYREWAGIARTWKLAEAASRRVESALVLTSGVAFRTRWTRLILAADMLGADLVALAADQLRGVEKARRVFRRPSIPTGRFRTNYLWRKEAAAKRILSKAEWATVADDARSFQASLVSIGHSVRVIAPDPESNRWYRLADRVESARLDLAKLAYRQHSDPKLSNLLTVAA